MGIARLEAFKDSPIPVHRLQGIQHGKLHALPSLHPTTSQQQFGKKGTTFNLPRHGISQTTRASLPRNIILILQIKLINDNDAPIIIPPVCLLCHSPHHIGIIYVFTPITRHTYSGRDEKAAPHLPAS